MGREGIFIDGVYNIMSELKKYTAMVKLRFWAMGEDDQRQLQRISPGDIFSFDGSEGVDVDLLLKGHAIREYQEPIEVKDGKDIRKGRRHLAK